jgi:hypothetical protein
MPMEDRNILPRLSRKRLESSLFPFLLSVLLLLLLAAAMTESSLGRECPTVNMEELSSLLLADCIRVETDVASERDDSKISFAFL